MNTSGLTIKVIVLVHFILSVWGSMGNYLPATYIYVNAGVLVCGLWAVAQPQSPDAILMTLVTLLFSVLEDIVLLALYEPRGHTAYEESNTTQSQRNEYRFALGMAITNLIMKPLSAVLLVRILQATNGNDDFTIPGIDRIPGVGGAFRGGYSDIDQSPDSAPYTTDPESSSPPPSRSDGVEKE